MLEDTNSLDGAHFPISEYKDFEREWYNIIHSVCFHVKWKMSRFQKHASY